MANTSSNYRSCKCQQNVLRYFVLILCSKILCLQSCDVERHSYKFPPTYRMFHNILTHVTSSIFYIFTCEMMIL